MPARKGRRVTGSGASDEQALTPKPVSASRTELVEVVLPNDTNPLGNVLGGRVMHLIDIAGAIAAHRHANSLVVTASVDHIDFRHPIKVGNLIVLKSQVNRVFHTSMEVGVEVYSEDVLTGERVHTSSAYVTFVAIGPDGKPRRVPPLLVRTAAERRRYREAGLRRRLRLAHRYGTSLEEELRLIEQALSREKQNGKKKR
jgi:acyl-CoA hydrolase